METCTRRLQFASGHRVYGHENKCANLHGHNYVVFLKAAAPQLDSVGRVIDFSVLKERIGDWIERHWDHAFIWNHADPVCSTIFHQNPDQKNFCADFNPTAEEMARFLLRVVGPLMLADTNVRLIHVELFETENCKAEATFYGD